MKQPQPNAATEDLAEWLRLAVPLCSIDLADRAQQHFGDDQRAADRWLAGIVRRGSTGLNRGDALAYPSQHAGSQRTTAAAAQQIAEAVAAAGLLAGRDGITVWGVHFCPLRPCPHAATPAP